MIAEIMVNAVSQTLKTQFASATEDLKATYANTFHALKTVTHREIATILLVYAHAIKTSKETVAKNPNANMTACCGEIV